MKRKLLMFLTTIILLFSFVSYSRALEESKLFTGVDFNGALAQYCFDNNITELPYVVFGKYSDYADKVDKEWDDSSNVSVSSDNHTKIIKGTYNSEQAIFILTDKDKIVFNESSRAMFSAVSSNPLGTTKEIIFNNIDTSNTQSMELMFASDVSLERLNLSMFDTSNVTTMGSMFYHCESLTSLDLRSFNTSKVTNMHGMFENCNSLESVNLSSFDTSNVIVMDRMFSLCTSLTNLNISNFNTSKVLNISYMFNNCDGLTSLDLSNFDTSNVLRMEHVFSGCDNLTDLNISSFNTSNVTTMEGMFYNCTNITSLDLSNFDTSKVTNMHGMFRDCHKLTNLNISSFNTSNVKNMSAMFQQCEDLPSLDLSHFDTSKVTNMGEMFRDCYDLSNLDISSFNTENVTNMYGMFSGCSGLTTLDLRNFNTENVTNMKNMFSSCYNLKTIYVLSFDLTNVTESTNMFSSSNKIVGGKGTTYNSSYLDKTYARIDNAPDEPGYFTKVFIVTFNTNGGQSDITELPAIAGEIISYYPTPIKDRYSFAGWYTTNELTTLYDKTLPVEGDLELFAKYYLKYDWDNNNELELQDIFLYRQYLSKGTGSYDELDEYRKIALNGDNNIQISLVDLVSARIALANK